MIQYHHISSAKGLQRMNLLWHQVDREQDRITILLISNFLVEIFSKIDRSIKISVEYGYIYDIRN